MSETLSYKLPLSPRPLQWLVSQPSDSFPPGTAMGGRKMLRGDAISDQYLLALNLIDAHFFLF
jgi:hypothetical protein